METPSSTMQPPWQGIGGGDDPKPSSSTPASYGMRKSCEPCRRRKKKCDGERPCCRCLRTRDECTYSKRRWHLHCDQQQCKGQQHRRELAKRDDSRMHQMQALRCSTSSATLGHNGMLPFKRCRLSASPATGLVGMQENSFLSDFFGCVGFLPLATQSHIRETLVKIMLSPASRHQSALEEDCGDAGQHGAIATRWGFGNTFDGEGLSIGPSACVFWCSVALGALVTNYIDLATEALVKSYSAPADAEVAKAWLILGCLYGFMGDEATFQEYLALSDTFVTTSIAQGSTDELPLGFTEVLQHREMGDTSHRKIESMFACEQALPQLNGGASAHELYRYVMRSFRVFEKATFSEMLNHRGAVDNERSGGAEPAGGGIGDQPQDISEAMASVWSKGNILQFEPLQEAADRPSIRAGMGGMLINGTLVFDLASKGDVLNTFKRVGRCVEVFVRYPGLCRSVMGAHWAHLMSAALVSLDVPGAREMYDMLRGVYNPFRPNGSPPLPPLEEWRGMSGICEDTYCRAIEGVIASDKMRAFSNPADRSVPRESSDDEGENSLGLGGQNQSQLLTATITPGDEPFTPAPCPLGTGVGDSDESSSCGASWALHRVDQDGTERWLESTRARKVPAASASHTLAANGCNSEEEFDDGAGNETDVAHGENHVFAGGLVAPHGTLLMIPQGCSEGAMEGVEEEDVAAVDWLEVTHALLDESFESA